MASAQINVTVSASFSAGSPVSVDAVDTITTSGTVMIASGANVKFEAGNKQIRLKPGFTAVSGCIFRASLSRFADADHDRIPDEWELSHGLDPLDLSDALSDADGDGLTNLNEYLQGLDPNKAGNSLTGQPGRVTTFDPCLSGNVYALAIQQDGKIIAAGTFTSTRPNGISTAITRNHIARFNPDGTLDTSFNPNIDNYVYALALQSDGKLLVGGDFDAVGGVARGKIARLNADGTLDSQFHPNPAGTLSPSVRAILVQSNGQLVFGGMFDRVQKQDGTTVARMYVARYNSDGTLDESFDPSADGYVCALAEQADKKILIGGGFDKMGFRLADLTAGLTRNHIARVSSDGTLDASFDPNLDDLVRVISVQPNGTILVGGAFTAMQPNGAASTTSVPYLVRLKADGTRDATFSAGLSAPSSGYWELGITSILPQIDGGCIVGGAFSNVGETQQPYICRIGSNGSFDETFTPLLNGNVCALAQYPSGSVVAGGYFITLSTTIDRRHLALFDLVRVPVSIAGGPFEYDGDSHGPGAETSPAGLMITRTGTWSARDVGSYTAIATVHQKGYMSGPVSYLWKIVKGSQVVWSHDDTGKVGSAWQPDYLGGLESGPWQFYVDGVTTWPSSAVTGTNISGTVQSTWTPTQSGTYTFYVRRIGNVNASGSAVAGPYVLTVSSASKLSQSVTFAALPSRVLGCAPFALNATASSGLPVSYTVTGPASVSGAILKITGTGSVSVIASQAGDDTYKAATSVPQSFTVTSPSTNMTDSDGDGMSDAWETANGLNPHDATDARSDLNGDGLSNIAEYNLANDPKSTATKTWGDAIGNVVPAWPARDSSKEEAVGTTGGRLGVDASGAATYEVPLFSAPGVAGLEPHLSLKYSSTGGNGIVGVGWHLAGLSMITRGASSAELFASDTKSAAVSMESDDRFFLDGNRLELVAGSGSYGSNSSEYRTSLETFVRVIYHRSTASSWFEVWTKDGRRLEFGHDAQSCAGLAPGAAWLLSKVEDGSGNYLTVSYSTNDDNLQHFPVPKEISYTGNGSVAPSSAVRFYYEKRPSTDILHLDQAGLNDVDVTHRLASISAVTQDGAKNEQVVRRYVLTYDTSAFTSRSRLQRIQEYGVNDTRLPATSFDWNTDSYSFTTASLTSATLADKDDSIYVGDFNGDGKSDVLIVGKRRVRHTQLYLSNGTGLAVSGSAFDLNSDSSFDNGTDTISVGDIDGDGLADIVGTFVKYSVNSGNSVNMTVRRRAWLARKSGASVTFLLQQSIPDRVSTWSAPGGTFVTPPSTLERLMDLDGSGKASLLSAESEVIGSHVWSVATFNPTTGLFDQKFGGTDGRYVAEDDLRLAEVNGDGIPDVWVADYNDGGGMLLVNHSPTWGTGASLSPGNSSLVFGDFNGDRVTDVLELAKSGSGRYVRSGADHFDALKRSSVSASAEADWYAQTITAADFNGDGRDDLVVQRSASSDLWVTTGSASSTVAFAKVLSITNGPKQNELAIPMDLNGDGRLDLLVRGNVSAGNTALGYRILVAGGTQPGDVISKVTNGLGAWAKITFAPLTDSSVYTKGSALSGLVDLQTPTQVVKSIQYDLAEAFTATSTTAPASAGDASFTQTYTYAGLRAAPYRGAIGFAAQEVKDSRTQVTTRIERRQTGVVSDYALNGFVTRTVAKRGSVILADTTITPTIRSLNSGNTSFVYPSSVVAKTWDINSGMTAQGDQTSNTTTSEQVDDWGNVTTVSVDYGFGGRTATRTATYWPVDTSGTHWWIARLKSDSSTTKATDYTSVTRQTDFYYRDNDDISGNESQGAPQLVTESVVNASDAATKLTTVYTYGDSFGHVTKVAVTGHKNATTDQTRTVSAEYDASGRFLTKLSRTAPSSAGGSLVTTFVPDYLHSGVSYATDENNDQTDYSYDDFGRLVAVTTPDNVTTTSIPGWTSDSHGVFSVQTRSTVIDQGVEKYVAPPSCAIYDRLGRLRRSGTVTVDAEIAWSDTVYNSWGAPLAGSSPSRPRVVNSDPAYWSMVTYDALGRPQTRSLANGTSVSTAYDGLDTTVTVTDYYLAPGDSSGTTTTRTARYARDYLGHTVGVYRNEGIGSTVERDSVTYGYDAAGNLATVTSAGVDRSTVYDNRGYPTSIVDPNAGPTTPRYNAFGELYSTKDAKAQTITFDYDILGRTVTRTDPGSAVTTWSYDAASGKGLGLPSSVTGPDAGGGTYTETYTYDTGVSRLKSTQKTIDGLSFTTTLGYDFASRPSTVAYQVPGFATSQQFKYIYNAIGALREVRDMQAPAFAHGQLLWALTSGTPYGQPENEILGNGVQGWTGYRLTDGSLEQRIVASGLTLLESLRLGRDSLGNVRRRELLDDDSPRNVLRSEDYGIDALDRLTSVKLNGTTKQTIIYDVQGNVTSRTDVGSYAYDDSAHPHAATTAGANTYAYDANGNLTTRNGTQEITWTTFDQPRTITRGSASSSFRYGTGRERVEQTTSAGETTRYVGPGLEYVTKGGVTSCRFAIFAPGGRIAHLTVSSDGTRTPLYFAGDQLGSLESITDASGQVLESLSYSPWGQRRKADWTAGTPTRATTVNRGFTDHEMLDALGLVHMNGRVYDPAIGRFLSVDPVVSDPLNAQTYNGYSYVANNPTSMIDPSGYAPDATFYSPGSDLGGLDVYGGGSGSSSWFNFGFSFGDYAFTPGGNVQAAMLWAQFLSRFGAPPTVAGAANSVDANSYRRPAGAGATEGGLDRSMGIYSDGRILRTLDPWNSASPENQELRSAALLTSVSFGSGDLQGGLGYLSIFVFRNSYARLYRARLGVAIEDASWSGIVDVSRVEADTDALAAGLGELYGGIRLRGFARLPAAESLPKTTRLFRAVEKAELDDVLRYGDYNIHPNSTFKRFAFDEGSLDAFIKANPGRNYTKTFIDLPTEKLDFMIRHGDPGGVGKAIGIDVFENPQFYDWFKGVNILGPK